jgi:hypothetical protein
LNVETERFCFNLAALNAERKQEYLVYGDIADDDPLIDYHHVEVGKDEPETLRQAVDNMLSNAMNTGILSEAGNAKLKEFVYKHRDIWALKMGAGEQANVPPLRIQLKPGAKPVRVSTRTYSPPQMRFMEAKLKE